MSDLTQNAEFATRRRLLIVDDDDDLSESLRDILIKRDYQVELAGSLNRARDIARDFEPEVALLDIRLGGETGLDVMEILKGRNPDVLCVMITGHAEVDTAIDALRQGAYDYLSKPLHPKELLAVLDRCFENIRLTSERRAAFDALSVAKEAAETANRAKSNFLAAMSHELRTPLHSIIGFSEILLNQSHGELGSEKYLDYLGDIKNSGNHLLSVINDILDIAKAEAGKLDIRECRSDLPQVIDLTLRIVRPQAQDAGVNLSARIAADLPQLRADERRLRQILLNLLSNAIKFTPSGGDVEITVELDAAGDLLIIVRDTGIGIACHDIPRALSPFSQIENDLSRGYEGTGLGLSLSVMMAELHDGSLTLESELGAGTTVTVRFPGQRIIPQQREAV